MDVIHRLTKNVKNMPVKIRLTRRGRRNMAIYDIVVADSKSPRDGKFIEKLGTFNPLVDPAGVVLNDDKTLQWIMNGAQPTDTVRTLLSDRGIMLRKHLQVGVVKGAITQEKADKQFADWLSKKTAVQTSKTTVISNKKEEERKSKLAAEAKVNEARKDALKAKNLAALAAADAAANPAPEAQAETPATEEPKAE
jgi:small subunit ribosomal protein S16